MTDEAKDRYERNLRWSITQDVRREHPTATWEWIGNEVDRRMRRVAFR